MTHIANNEYAEMIAYMFNVYGIELQPYSYQLTDHVTDNAEAWLCPQTSGLELNGATMLFYCAFFLFSLNVKDDVLCVQSKPELSVGTERETIVPLAAESSSCGCHNLKREAVVDIEKESSKITENPAVKYSKKSNERHTDTQTNGEETDTRSQVLYQAFTSL